MTAKMTNVNGIADAPAMEVAARSDRLRALFAKAGCEALLVTNLKNIRYLTGFSGTAASLLVSPDALLFVTDGRYDLQSHEQLASARVDAEIVVGGMKAQKEALQASAKPFKHLGLEATDVSWSQERAFAKEWFSQAELVPTVTLIERLRRIKDAGEIWRVARAAEVADEALANTRQLLHEAISELDFAVELDFEIRRLGASGNSFDTIVASGRNAAKPHHSPSERVIDDGELVVLDFGAIVDGYCSDMTRTVCVGEPRADLQRMFDVVAESQSAGVDAVRKGATCEQVDSVCRQVIDAAGWGDKFTHSTGHGVGLDVHEFPWVASGSADPLESGYVVTVEPGVYIPELGGVRIEDTVVVTGEGCRILTNAPKALAA